MTQSTTLPILSQIPETATDEPSIPGRIMPRDCNQCAMLVEIPKDLLSNQIVCGLLKEQEYKRGSQSRMNFPWTYHYCREWKKREPTT